MLLVFRKRAERMPNRDIPVLVFRKRAERMPNRDISVLVFRKPNRDVAVQVLEIRPFVPVSCRKNEMKFSVR